MSGSGKAYTSQEHGFEAMNPGPSQTVSINSNSIQSSAFGLQTTIVRLFATQDCFLAFGLNPTAAVSTGYFMPAGIIDFVGVIPSSKIAVLQSSAVGNLYITEGS